MKKIVFAAAVAALAFTACNSGNSCKSGNDGDKNELYTGVLPAADADGILYNLSLDFDDDHNFTDGDYHLTETYLMTDTVRGKSFDGRSFKTEGDFKVETRTVDGKEVKYLKLTPEAKESVGNASSDVLYFIIDSDNSITLTDAELSMPGDSLNYTLKRQ